jgi:hypothetical protein
LKISIRYISTGYENSKKNNSKNGPLVPVVTWKHEIEQALNHGKQQQQTTEGERK